VFIDFLVKRFSSERNCRAIVWREQAYTYAWLSDQIATCWQRLAAERVERGSVATLDADFSPRAVALFLALIERGCVVVPLSPAVSSRKAELANVAQANVLVTVDADQQIAIQRHGRTSDHALYDVLWARRHPGLVLFTSGSTGVSKAALHDVVPLLDKFRLPRPALTTLAFMLFDHIGGLNTMLHTLANLGCLVIPPSRQPDVVLAAVEQQQVEALPVSPTFLNLLLISGAYARHSLASLKLVTYGSEPISESTLQRFHELFPAIQLKQTYGLSEVGILRSRSRAVDSTWLKVGGEDYQTRVVDGVLQIKSGSMMLGYLNAPANITEDGWLDTGDLVDCDGEYVRFRGRTTDTINVGGEKVYPVEVESVIQEHPDVAEVTVYGEPNSLTGFIVRARVTPRRELNDEAAQRFAVELKRWCRRKLRPYQVPARVLVVSETQHSDRFKRVRP
jgi:acyl-coenzyme A synthetase/AMP-(fatty) acid ligase